MRKRHPFRDKIIRRSPAGRGWRIRGRSCTVVAVALSLGRGWLVIGCDVAAAPAVAVAAADSVPGAGMADADAVQAAAARLVMAAVILGTIKIAHKNTSVRTVCAGTEAVIRGAYSVGSPFPVRRNYALTARHGSRQIYTNRAIVRSMTSLNSGLLMWAFMPESRHFFTSSA